MLTPTHCITSIHQQKLLSYLDKTFREPVSFADFMQAILYAPGLGYYSAGLAKLGAAGDFTTAPEISSLFSYTLAHQFAQILEQLKSGPNIIFELGAGSGQLCFDVLTQLSHLNSEPDEYWILEVSADLIQRQQQLLQSLPIHLFNKIKWLNSLPSNQFQGIIFANEVLDAMPVNLFKIENERILEGIVFKHENQWKIKFDVPITPPLVPAVHRLQEKLTEKLPTFYMSEINLQLEAWIKSITENLTRGVVLFIDYGFKRDEYYHPSRDMGTLMCHYRHQSHTNPMLNIGLQDVTAHVDFSAVSDAFNVLGFDLIDFTTQSHFLINHGLLELAQQKMQDAPHLAHKISQQLQFLLQPHEMGELFKVITFAKQFNF